MYILRLDLQADDQIGQRSGRIERRVKRIPGVPCPGSVGKRRIQTDLNPHFSTPWLESDALPQCPKSGWGLRSRGSTPASRLDDSPPQH